MTYQMGGKPVLIFFLLVDYVFFRLCRCGLEAISFPFVFLSIDPRFATSPTIRTDTLIGRREFIFF